MLAWPPMDPDEVQDNFVTWEFPTDGETIVTSTFTVESGTVEIVDQDFDGNVTRVRLSGGTLGEVCEVLNHVVTTTGEEYDSTQKLRIRRH